MIDPTLVTNHLAVNLVTKGTLNISAIEKGMLVMPAYPEPMLRRKRGGLGWAEPTRYVDPNAIQINIDWFKKVPKHKTIGVELSDVEKYIKAELIKESTEFKSETRNIEVELLQPEKKPKIKIELIEVEIN